MRVAALRVLQIGAIAIVLVASTQTMFDLDRFLVPKELVLHLIAFFAALLAFGAIRRMAFTRVDWLLIIYLLLSAVSVMMATNRWLGFRALAVSASGVLIFWTARALRDSGFELPLLNAMAIAVVIAAATALAQAYGLRLSIFATTRVPGGTLGNRNFVAHVAALGLPLLFFAALRSRYFIWCAGVAVVSASLVLTRSRGAWLAADNPYLKSVRGVVSYDEGSGRGRLVQYRQSLWMAAAHPLFGVGPGNWPVVYPAYAARNDPSLNPSEPGMTFNPWPSSDWMAFVSERGLVTTVILLLAFVGIAFASPNAAVLAIIVATIVAGLFDAVLLLAVPALIVWASLGALTQPSSAVRGPRIVTLVIVILMSAIGVVRSAAQLVAMEMYPTRVATAATIDPGNYRIQLRLASRCAHAKAAQALFPNAEESRRALRRCRP